MSIQRKSCPFTADPPSVKHQKVPETFRKPGGGRSDWLLMITAAFWEVLSCSRSSGLLVCCDLC